jgi:hypothetical protein
MSDNCGTPTIASLKALAKMIEASAKAGVAAVQSLTGELPDTLSGVVDWAASQAGKGQCNCDIPSPCWMPRELCEVISYGKAGNVASITFVITNHSMTDRVLTISTTTPLAGLAFNATHLSLGPMQRGSVEVTYTIPTTLTSGPGTEILLWIQGCRLYFLRWTVKLGPVSGDTNYEVCVNDQADYLHHWYDHFYCQRPCLPDQRAVGR